MAFVCKQTAVLVIHINSITLDNNNDVLTDLLPFSHFILYYMPELARLVVVLLFF